MKFNMSLKVSFAIISEKFYVYCILLPVQSCPAKLPVHVQTPFEQNPPFLQ